MIKEIYTEELLNQFEKEAIDALEKDELCELFVNNPNYAELFLWTRSKDVDEIANTCCIHTCEIFEGIINPKLQCSIVLFQDAFKREHKKMKQLRHLEKLLLELKKMDTHELFFAHVFHNPFNRQDDEQHCLIAESYHVSLDITSIPDIKRAIDSIRKIKDEPLNTEKYYSRTDEDEVQYSCSNEDDAIDLSDPALEE